MKKYIFKRKHILLLFLLLFLSGCAKAGTGAPAPEKRNTSYGEQKALAIEAEEEKIPDKEADFSESYIRLMPDVTMDMLSEEHWIDKLEAPDAVILSSEEIDVYNTSSISKKSERNKFLAYSKEDAPRSITEEDLTSYLEESEVFHDAYFKSGEKIADSYWESVKENSNYDAAGNRGELSYGFAVKRGQLRQFPDDAVVSTTETFTFFDEMQISTMLIGEPVIITVSSKDDEWCFVLTDSCCGWTRKENIAVSDSYETWNQDRDPKDFLVVTGDEITLEYDDADPDISETELTMGCKLPLVSWEEYSISEEGRVPYGNYVIRLPIRKEDGSLVWKYAFVPCSRDVHEGFLEYNQRNLLHVAFQALGNRYGWGGMYHARDCSQYIMEIYRCFGIKLPRNSTGLSELNTETVSVQEMDSEEKEKALHKVPPGSILYLKGHVMLYLGEENGHDYVISSSASSIPDDSDKVVPVHSVVINDLNVRRRNGLTWLEALEKYKLIR